MKEKKLRELEENLEEGIISKEEYEKKRKEIEDMPEQKAEEANEEKKEDIKLKSDKALIIGAVLIILLFISVFGLRYFAQEKPETIDDLHKLNLKGKLKPEQGYLYDGVYSFVKFDDLWYTQLMSPKGSRFYNIQFRYDPKEVDSIKIEGWLDTTLFNNATDYYVTFDPTGNDFSSVAVAVGDFNQQMTSVFFKNPIAACDRNETTACKDRPIITCDNTNKMVLYVKEANNTRVYYDNNCIVVEGSGMELVKGIDRVLYDFYEIIKR
ncbi:hypothetical protein KY347_04225 [Candidatus Woesearchaeota archaeon]|nr:hypothetical protein [Candidatus Woesearchaeota archaeon]